MNILGYNISITRLQRPPALEQRAADPAPWLRGEAAPTGPVLANAYQQVVWVYRAINVLAEQVANVPFRFSRGQAGGENLIHTGPLIDFYAQPHAHINSFQYWELRVIWLLLRGECFRIPLTQGPEGARRAGLASVLLLDPAQFQHVVEDHQLIGWRYTGFGPRAPLASQVFLPEEVWFDKLPNPFDFWRGMSPLQVAGLAAQTDFAAGAYMKGLMENNADNGLIVRTGEHLGEEQREQVKAALRERKRRAGTADQPLLLAQTAEIIQPALSSSDLQFLQNRKFSRGEICAAFGVPEEIVTTTDTAKYDVMAGARLNFIENRVAPLCRRLEAAEQVTVRRLDPEATGWFDLDSLPLLQQARRNRLAAAKVGFDMGLPFNELNRVFELGFKPLPWGDRGYLPAGLRLVGDVAPALPKAAPPLGPSHHVCPADVAAQLSQFLARLDGESSEVASEPVEHVPAEGIAAPQPVPAPAQSGSGDTPAENDSPSTPVGSPPLLSPQIAGGLRRKVSRFLFEQRGRVLARLTAAESDAAPFDVATEDTALLRMLTPLLTAGDAPAPPALPPELAPLNTDTLAALGAALTEGRGRGEGPEQLAARVKAIYRHTGNHQE